MTTDQNTTTLSIDSAHRTVGWIPRSTSAWLLLLLGFLVVAHPLFYVAGAAVLQYLCFDSCYPAGDTIGWVVLAILLAAAPPVAVRIHQSRLSFSGRVRLALGAGLILFWALAGTWALG